MLGGGLALAVFVLAAVSLTRWLDVQSARVFFSPAGAPTCAPSDCPPEAHRPTVEPAAVVPPRVAASVAAKLSDLSATDAAGPRSAELGLRADVALRADAGVRGDAGPIAPFAAPAAAVAPIGSAAPPTVDASRAPLAASDASVPQARNDQPDARAGVRCGPATCSEGQVCCNASCGICRAPGASCSQVQCGPINPSSASCGPNTCNVGEVCCNASCGICTQPGGTCSQQRCDGVQVPISVPCGPNTCNVGQVCCNASCGICTNPGESCRREPCP